MKGSKKIPGHPMLDCLGSRTFSRLSRFSRSLRNRNICEKGMECAKNLGGWVNGRQKRTLVDYVDKPTIMISANSHAGYGEIVDCLRKAP
jgi:hypothetical protein